MANVIYAPEADDDLLGIVEYIARDKPEAARTNRRRSRSDSADMLMLDGVG